MARRGTYPVPIYENQPATNVLFRGVEEGTITEEKNNNIKATSNFTQPQCPTAEYPKNHVWATARNVFELDDTGSGRVNLHHGSGSFVEMYPDGEIVIHANKDVDIIAENQCNIYCKDNASIDVGKDCVLDVKGNLDATITEQTKISSGADMKLTVKGRLDIVATDIIDIRSGQDIVMHGETINQKANEINQDAYDGLDMADDAQLAIDTLNGDVEKNAGNDDDWLQENQDAYLHNPTTADGKSWNKEIKENASRSGNNCVQSEGASYDAQIKELKKTNYSGSEILQKFQDSRSDSTNGMDW